MAWPAFFKKTEVAAQSGCEGESVHRLKPEALEPVRPGRDPYLLRALPHEDVFFYSKKIDNSRLVRAADPKAGGACWAAIGAACLALALLTSVLAPVATNTLAGYKLEALRAEERHLLDQHRGLELQEAELVSPSRLEILAKGQNLVIPAAGQTVRLESKDGSLALNRGQEPEARGR